MPGAAGDTRRSLPPASGTRSPAFHANIGEGPVRFESSKSIASEIHAQVSGHSVMRRSARNSLTQAINTPHVRLHAHNLPTAVGLVRPAQIALRKDKGRPPGGEGIRMTGMPAAKGSLRDLVLVLCRHRAQPAIESNAGSTFRRNLRALTGGLGAFSGYSPRAERNGAATCAA